MGRFVGPVGALVGGTVGCSVGACVGAVVGTVGADEAVGDSVVGAVVGAEKLGAAVNPATISPLHLSGHFWRKLNSSVQKAQCWQKKFVLQNATFTHWL